ncbi:hypothetical protein V2H26_03600 [Xanthomonas euvesicatoria]|uniref:hypothetical protein n=1 Tax=Xanthomonas citri TaxID=346 RepID=UPI000F7FE0B5|nr:hypothetical protein [Xanthomonas axonopodis]MEE5089175.1 hypothetical protein [Xanthomonas euvesicatoria]RTE58892.1 hypothetical protein EI541_03015 [Xanthomonas axonopodis pv. eucalyptorum]
MDFWRKISVSLGFVSLLYLAGCDQDAGRQGSTIQSQNSQKATDQSRPQEKNSSKVLEPRAVSKASAALTPDSESVDIQKLTGGFKEGMPYGDLRKKVIAGNWKPVVSAECKKNVVGDDFESVCSKDPGQCAICDEVPELNICSGDGHCITEFSSVDGRQSLKVSTYGEIRDALVEGEKSRLFVSWWDVSSKAN